MTDVGVDTYELTMPSGNRMMLNVATPITTQDRLWLHKLIDLLLADSPQTTKHLTCNECGAPVTSPVPQSTITTAYSLCPDCLEAIPDDIANLFFEHAAKRAKALKEEQKK